MTPSILNFAQALLDPGAYFKTLRAFEVARNKNGMPVLVRRTRFVESCIRVDSQLYIISCPLHQDAVAGIRRIAVWTRYRISPYIIPFRILDDEMSFVGVRNTLGSCDIVLQPVPEGRSLADCMRDDVRPEQLRMKFRNMQADLAENLFSHNDLRPDNIVFLKHYVPRLIRHYGCRYPGISEADRQAFGRLLALADLYEANREAVRDGRVAPERLIEEAGFRRPAEGGLDYASICDRYFKVKKRKYTKKRDRADETPENEPAGIPTDGSAEKQDIN